MLTVKRDKKDAGRILDNAIENNGLTARISIDESRSNKEAIRGLAPASAVLKLNKWGGLLRILIYPV
jgi:transposase-like protein